MPGKLAHQATEDGVLVVLRPSVGAPSSLRVDPEEAIRFARAVLDDLGAGDGLGSGGRAISIGALVVDTSTATLSAGDKLIRLTGCEYRLIEALALRAGHTLTKELLLGHIYLDRADEPELKIIDVFVCKIRHKLRVHGANQQLETVWGRGYRLVPTAAPGGWERPHVPSGVQGAILARLEHGPATMLSLWTACPEAPQQSVRNALQTLRQRGAITSNGDPRNALYALVRRAAA